MKKLLFVLTFVLPLIFTSCSKDDDKSKLSLSTDQISLYSEDLEQITASEKVKWNSNNEFIATVNSVGMVSGQHVGKTIITAIGSKGKAECEVKVKAKYNTFTEPVFKFGASKSTIKSEEKRGFQTETETGLLFSPDKSTIQGVTYLFENGKMKAAGVFVNLSSSLDATNFLLERYIPVTTGSGNIVGIMLNNFPDLATMSIAIDVESKYVLVMYAAYDSVKSRSIVEKDIMENEMKELFNSMK